MPDQGPLGIYLGSRHSLVRSVQGLLEPIRPKSTRMSLVLDMEDMDVNCVG